MGFFFLGQLIHVIPDYIHLLPGSFLNCIPSSSLFWGTKNSLMLCLGCQIATWRGEVAERWIMPPASGWGPATEHCPRPTSSPSAADAPRCARRYTHFDLYKELSLNNFRVERCSVNILHCKTLVTHLPVYVAGVC